MSFNLSTLHEDPMGHMPLLLYFPFCRWKHQGAERWRSLHLTQIAELDSESKQSNSRVCVLCLSSKRLLFNVEYSSLPFKPMESFSIFHYIVCSQRKGYWACHWSEGWQLLFSLCWLRCFLRNPSCVLADTKGTTQDPQGLPGRCCGPSICSLSTARPDLSHPWSIRGKVLPTGPVFNFSKCYL